MILLNGAVLVTALIGFSALTDAVSHDGLVGFVPGAAGGCMKSRLCCPGKDHTCRVFETVKEGDKARRKCFCDSECLANKDCCNDYQYYCQPVDCVVEEKWQKWSKCSVPCGQGVKNRTRRVIQYPRNGGKECETTLQHSVCEGVECKVLRTAASHQPKVTEIANILPNSFARWRSDAAYSSRADIRRNLVGRRRQRSFNGSSVASDNYCATYRLTEVSRMCGASSRGNSAASNWTRDLVSGMVICVECQPTAAHANLRGRCNGDGVVGIETRWAAMTVSGCKGKWKMISLSKECHCLEKHQQQQQQDNSRSLDFIFI